MVVVDAKTLAEWLSDVSNLAAELKLEFGEVHPLLDTGLLTMMNSIDKYINYINKALDDTAPPAGETGR